ncbi:uncharacterized protein ATC70_006703 [Mucor velutinosus]|uniref:BZIP domain-containing protein n=2 Tax=Mucor TaxID=4830 RepID=A0AAN7I3M0_9FUNG|nr:hypothetical protein ATC70_006703 [Mucor velutinosus]
MEHLFSSYQSPLDPLVFDSVIEPSANKPLDMETKANLELWTNAQFTYDIQPGSGLPDESIKSTLSSVSSPESIATTFSSSSPSTITYESLANYLDFELPQQHLTSQLVAPPRQQPQQQPQQQVQQQHQQRQAPQLLLPKISPNTTLEEIAKVLLSNIPNTATTVTASKVPMTSTTSMTHPAKVSKEKSAVEEDKRKRNTAASARFRIKKKQREQSMEKTVQEMTEKSTGLENRVKELELEIKFLRGLLIEKKQEEAKESNE